VRSGEKGGSLLRDRLVHFLGRYTPVFQTGGIGRGRNDEVERRKKPGTGKSGKPRGEIEQRGGKEKGTGSQRAMKIE